MLQRDPGLGFEPRITGSEPVVMPFHYPGEVGKELPIIAKAIEFGSWLSLWRPSAICSKNSVFPQNREYTRSHETHCSFDRR